MNIKRNTLLLTVVATTLFSGISAENDNNATMRSHYASKNDLATSLDQVTGTGFNPQTMSNATLATTSAALATLVYSVTVGNVTLGSLVNSTAVGNVTLGSLINSSTVGNVTLGSLVNSTAVGNVTLGSLVNSSAVGNVTLGSLINSSTVGNVTLGSLVNSSTIGNLTLGSLTNDADYGNLTLGSLVNSSTIGNLTLGSLITAMQKYTTVVANSANHGETSRWNTPDPEGVVTITGEGGTITFTNTGVYLVSGQFTITINGNNNSVALAAEGNSTKIPNSPALLVSNGPLTGVTEGTMNISFTQIITATEGQTLLITPTLTNCTINAESFKMNIIRIS